MKTEKYNGWTNYITWRINLEWFDGLDFGGPTNAQDCEELVVTILEDNCEYEHALTLALIALNDVNWNEIAQAKNEEYGYEY